MRRMLFVLWVSWLLAAGAGAECLKPINQWGSNPVHAVTVWGELAFYAVDNELVVEDVANLQQPVELGRISLGGSISGWGNLVAVDGYVYAAQSSELVVVSVENPGAPVIIGRHDLTTISFVCRPYLTVSNGHLWLVNCDMLHVFDLQEPSQPIPVGAFSIDARSVSIQGSYAYTSPPEWMGPPRGLEIIDVSDPANAEVVAAFSAQELWPDDRPDLPTPQRLVGITSGDERLFLTTNRGFAVCDLGDPLRPAPLAAYELAPSGPRDEDRLVADPSRDLVYLVRNGAGLQVVDVADPSAPSVLSTWAPARTLADLFVRSSTLFIAGTAAGLRIVDVSEPAEPVELNQTFDPRDITNIVGSGGALVAQDREVGLRVFTVGGSGQVLPTAILGGGWLVWDMEAVGDLVVVSASDELRVLSVADPSAPRELASLASTARHVALSADGSTAFTDSSESGGQILAYDLSDPTTPVLASVTPLFDTEGAELSSISEMAVANGYLWIMGQTDNLICKQYWDDEYWSGEQALLAVDVSDPLSPATVGSCYLGCAWVQALAVSDTHAYASAFVSEVEHWDWAIIDVQDPHAPLPVHQSAGWFPNHDRLRIVDNVLVAIADQWDYYVGIRLYDLETPDVPEEIAVFDHSGIVWDATVLGQRIYVAAAAAGIVTLSGQGCLPAVPFPSTTIAKFEPR